MAFFKKQQKKINGKWYPQVVTVGKPVTTDEVADRLSKISTVSRADTYAVLKDLADVLSDYMAQGRTVKLEGLGTFYYTAAANGQGVDSPEKVTAAQITGVRIRFIPSLPVQTETVLSPALLLVIKSFGKNGEERVPMALLPEEVAKAGAKVEVKKKHPIRQYRISKVC